MYYNIKHENIVQVSLTSIYIVNLLKRIFVEQEVKIKSFLLQRKRWHALS
jgi:hypothetical protein